jgi:hypothetical protein
LAGGAISNQHGLRMVFWAAAGVGLVATAACWRAWRLAR